MERLVTSNEQPLVPPNFDALAALEERDRKAHDAALASTHENGALDSLRFEYIPMHVTVVHMRLRALHVAAVGADVPRLKFASLLRVIDDQPVLKLWRGIAAFFGMAATKEVVGWFIGSLTLQRRGHVTFYLEVMTGRLYGGSTEFLDPIDERWLTTMTYSELLGLEIAILNMENAFKTLGRASPPS